MSAYSGLIKVTKKGATAPAKAPPFYSAVDEVAQGLSRNKGTGKEFLREIEKTKGVKPAEIKDRKLDKILNTDQKMTKDELVKVLEDNPPKQITEETPGGISKSMIDDKIYELIEEETKRELGPRPRLGYEREDWLEDFDRLIEEKSYRKDDYYQEAKEALMEEGNIGDAAYDRPDLKLPGGENYREILLKLPTFDPNKEKQLMELEANLRRMNPVNFPPGYLDSMKDEVAKLKAEKASFGQEYKSSHWTQPNVLAHMRVQDRVGPNGEKVLHVEEIQSDWHQAGRSKGYKSDVTTKINDEDYQRGLQLQRQDINGEPLTQAERQEMQDIQNRHIASLSAIKVPDAPFKKNWHELAMKRLINYASENGYDKIAITPGAEQASRYSLAKHVDSIAWERDANGKITFTPEKDGTSLTAPQTVDPQELSSHLGKDVAEKILKSQEEGGFIEGLDLKVGGEGMKGFYDQMLPAYLNKYGEKYGAKVSPIEVTRPPRDSTLAFGYPGGDDYVAGKITWNEFLKQSPHAAKEFSTQLHSFDITPSMREEVLTKGQPLYQQIGIPAATGAAGAGMLEDEPVFNRSEKVNITDNPDTMFLELNDQHYGVGGAAKKAIKALKGTQKVLPAAERDANLAKMLAKSQVKEPVFHAAKTDIKQFSPKHRTELSSMGHHFGTAEQANFRTGQYDFDSKTPNIGKYHLNIENPLEVSHMASYAPDHLAEQLMDMNLLTPERYDALTAKHNYDPLALGDELAKVLQKNGYDGLKYANEMEGEGFSFVPLKPNQIKSAIGNRGTYDTTQPDINEAQGGLATLKRK